MFLHPSSKTRLLASKPRLLVSKPRLLVSKPRLLHQKHNCCLKNCRTYKSWILQETLSYYIILYYTSLEPQYWWSIIVITMSWQQRVHACIERLYRGTFLARICWGPYLRASNHTASSQPSTVRHGSARFGPARFGTGFYSTRPGTRSFGTDFSAARPGTVLLARIVVRNGPARHGTVHP